MIVETNLEAENFDPEFAESVIVHMNQDHADALVLYVNAFTEFDQTKQATLTDINRRSMRLIINQSETEVSVKFEPPLRDANEVRPRLVEMVKLAREKLGEIK